MWKWIKSWFIRNKKVEFPTILLTIKPNMQAPNELLAHFEFDWPSNTSDEVLAMYYGRVLAYIQYGALYNTILGGFEVKYSKEKDLNPTSVGTGIAKQKIHEEFQKVMAKLMEGQQEQEQVLTHLRQPCMMPSEVFNFRNKMEKNGE